MSAFFRGSKWNWNIIFFIRFLVKKFIKNIYFYYKILWNLNADILMILISIFTINPAKVAATAIIASCNNNFTCSFHFLLITRSLPQCNKKAHIVNFPWLQFHLLCCSFMKENLLTINLSYGIEIFVCSFVFPQLSLLFKRSLLQIEKKTAEPLERLNIYN